MKTRRKALRLRYPKSMWPRRVTDRFKTQPRQQRTNEIQLIYAHFAPQVIFSVTEQLGHGPKPGNEFINTSSSSYKDASQIHLFAEYRPEVSQTSPAGVGKRIRL